MPCTVMVCAVASMTKSPASMAAVGAFRRPAQVGPHARQQFLNAEWLGHVVVGAGIERLDLGALVITHREHQHRRWRR